MKRTLNWTGRQKIPQELVTIKLTEGKPRSFAVELGELQSFKFPLSAKVYVEAYVNTSSMRFDFGSIGLIKHPADTALHELDDGGSLLFRLRVIDESGEVGKVLGAADGLRPRQKGDEDDMASLLPVRHCNLGEEIWRVELIPGVRPVLLLNNRIPELAERIRTDSLLRGAIVPHAIRAILRALFSDDRFGDDDSLDDWKAFAQNHLAEEFEEVEDVDQCDAKVEEVVGRYLVQTAFVTRYQATQLEEGATVYD